MGLSSGDIEKIREMIISVFKGEILKDIERSIDKRVQERIDKEVTQLRDQIDSLSNNVAELESKNALLEASLDRQEQSSRDLNVRIFGVAQKEGEELKKLVLEIFNKVECNVTAGDIKKCYRITAKGVADTDKKRFTRSKSGGANTDIDNRPAAILVRFHTGETRAMALQRRKQLNDLGVRIRQDLTKFRLSLLSKAVEKFSSRNAWCLHGNIYVRSGDVVHRITDFHSLEKLPAAAKIIRKQR